MVERRFRHELRLLKERIHLLEGFRKVFSGLDETIRIIRLSDGRKDAAVKLMKRFNLDEAQVNAVLDLRLYKLAKLEIQAILEELREKKKRVTEIKAILVSPKRLWTIVKRELRDVRENFGDKRRTRVGMRAIEEVTYDEEEFIVDEDGFILLSRDGWIKRVGRIGDLSKVRLRPEDELLAVVGGNTRRSVAFLSNLGSAYTMRINDVPASRGYGEPVQSFFKFRDGEKVIAAVSYDERVLSDIGSSDDREGKIPGQLGLAVSSSGYSLRFLLHPFSEPSTRTGRKFARLRPGEEVVDFHVLEGDEVLVIATKTGRVILFRAAEVKLLSGPGRGVMAIKIGADDRVIGSALSRQKSKGLRVYTTGGRKVDVTPRSYRVSSRGGKGVEVIKRGGLDRVEKPALELPDGINGSSAANGGAIGGDGAGRKRRR